MEQSCSFPFTSIPPEEEAESSSASVLHEKNLAGRPKVYYAQPHTPIYQASLAGGVGLWAVGALGRKDSLVPKQLQG
jgi:hypothetical protein